MTLLVDMSHVHVPVLAGELIRALDPEPGQLAVDCTFGAGGHARLVADRIGAEGTLIAIDRDPEAARCFEDFRAENATQATFNEGNFADVLPGLRAQGLLPNLIYMDLGMSSLQLDAPGRGFSYAIDAPLDMRMGPSVGPDARTIVNEWPEQRLAGVLREYGEERYARQIAREIVRRRGKRGIETTAELVDAIKAAVPVPAQFAGGHPARRTFQAIRIAVNDELRSLERGLPEAWALLEVGGRMGVISFHSLEDRRVKQFFGGMARGCICPPEAPVCVCGHEPEAELLSRRAIKPTDGEVANNPRARSARLRAARKLRGSRSPEIQDLRRSGR
jgi:16S rRNA (cytosine1402-N4)-methyltransferase